MWTLLSLITGLLIGNFLPRYFGQKGENLATKEGISEITSKIEMVKHEYATQLESIKAGLSAQLSTHGFRYEKEYEILSGLTGCLVDVRDSILSLRPLLDYVDPSKTEEQIKSERLGRYVKAQQALYAVRERKKPFYPDEIYLAVREVEKTAVKESVGYQYKNPRSFEGQGLMGYWSEVEKNQSQIVEASEKAIDKIRARVIKWDALSNG